MIGDEGLEVMLSDIERSEGELLGLTRRWAKTLKPSGARGFRAWLDAWASWWFERRGVMITTELSAKTCPELWQVWDDLAQHHPQLFAEPHFFGWLHQYYHEPDRSRSFKAHTQAQAKHTSQTLSTQLYTPRWMADHLILMCLEGWTPPTSAPTRLPQILDPAMGAGQLLLAAAHALIVRWPLASARQIIEALHGVELDPLAASVARANLALLLTTCFGPLDREALLLIEAQLRCGDGLSDKALGLGPKQERRAFDVVVSNPPYMGVRAMPAPLKQLLSRDHKPFHHDLYLAFMDRALRLSRWRVGLLTQQTVWFLGRFEPARLKLLEQGALLSFVHVGARAFGALTGEKASVVMSVHGLDQAALASRPPTQCVDLRPYADAQAKRDALERWLTQEDRASSADALLAADRLAGLPGQAMMYWLEPALLEAFAQWPTLGELAHLPGGQNKTGDNARFVRPWEEVPAQEIAFAQDLWAGPPNGRWRFYSKGGRYAPFWGNWDHVVDWSAQARAFYRDNRTSNLLDEAYVGRRGLCYTDFGGQWFAARFLPSGCVFDMAGPAIFIGASAPKTEAALEHEERCLFGLLALLNCSPVRRLLNALNPSLHYQLRDLRRLPIPPLSAQDWETLATLGRALMAQTRALHEDPADAPAQQALAELWSRAEALVCAWYGVAPQPLPEPMHHLLAGQGSGASSKRL